MIEPKIIEIDGLEFNLQPLPPLKSIKLDKKILSLLVPALGGLKNLSLNQEIDMETVAKGISESLQKLDDKEFEKLIVDLFSGSLFLNKNVEQGEAPTEEINLGNINRIFAGSHTTIYKLMFEVMKFNKFSPFVLGDGFAMKKIFTSPEQKDKVKKSGNKSEKSGN